MTPRELFRAIWSSKWYVMAAVVLVVAAGYVYAQRMDGVYEASAAVQLAVADTGTPGEVVSVDTNPAHVDDEAVRTAAATALGLSPAQLDAYTVDPTFDSSTSRVWIAVSGPSEHGSITVANALAKAYTDQLPTLVEGQVATIDARIAALSGQITQARQALTVNAADPVAAALQDAAEQSLKTLTARKTGYLSLVPPATVALTAHTAAPKGLGSTSLLGIALLAGLATGVAIALARRGLDTRVRTSAQAAQLAQAPVLAEITGVRKALHDMGSGGTLPVATRAATPFTESIRELRTAVQVSVGNGEHASVVVTATDSRGQRSFVAANLAASFALSGRRTILLSGDMRRRQVDRFLPMPGPNADVPLQGLRATKVANLFLFQVPDQLIDPADYLATVGVKSLVEALRADAEVLVIDAPPVLAAADATILGSYADGVVVTTTVGKSGQAVLADASERLRNNGVAIAGVALVGVPNNRRIEYAMTYEATEEVRAEVAAVQEQAPAEPAPVTVAVPRLVLQSSWATPTGRGQHSGNGPALDGRPLAPTRPDGAPGAQDPGAGVAADGEARPEVVVVRPQQRNAS